MLLVVIFAQIVLLAWQVKSDNDVPLVRVWAVTRGHARWPAPSKTSATGPPGFFSNYFELRNAREQSRKLRTEVDRLRLENQLLKNELASAQRAEALAGFQAHTPSKMIGARVIGTTTGRGLDIGADRSRERVGSAQGHGGGDAGRHCRAVLAVYPVRQPGAFGHRSGIRGGRGIAEKPCARRAEGLGNESAKVDYVPTGQKVEVGEMFYTSGEDRIFPQGSAGRKGHRRGGRRRISRTFTWSRRAWRRRRRKCS